MKILSILALVALAGVAFAEPSAEPIVVRSDAPQLPAKTVDFGEDEVAAMEIVCCRMGDG